MQDHRRCPLRVGWVSHPIWGLGKETPAISRALSVVLSAVLMPPGVLRAMVDYSMIVFPQTCGYLGRLWSDAYARFGISIQEHNM